MRMAYAVVACEGHFDLSERADVSIISRSLLIGVQDILGSLASVQFSLYITRASVHATILTVPGSVNNVPTAKDSRRDT